MSPRFALRALIRSPGFTIISLVTLALGIGLNTSMFSVVNTLLFRTAPYPDADQLVSIYATTRNGNQTSFSDQEIREITSQGVGFSSVTTFGHVFFAMAEPGRPAERVHALNFSSGMLDTFRVQPMLGRAFTPEEFEPGKNQVVILTESFWKSRFGGDRAIIGRSVRLDGEPVTIVGVMPSQFDYKMYWGNVGFIRPLNFTPDQSTIRDYRAFFLIGRLKPGTSIEAAVAPLGSVAAMQEKNFPKDYPGLRYRASPLNEVAIDAIGRALSWMLLGLSGFVLLIGCANLANLQLARATASMREFSIRAALGASRLRLLSQQLTECVLLSLAGGGLGFIVALWVNRLLERSIIIDGATGLHLPMDGKVLAMTLLVSLLTGVVFGIVPALFASRLDVNSALKTQARGSTTGRGHHTMRHILIVGEVALALVLLGGAAVMNRGFARFIHREAGWDTAHILTATLPMPESRFDTGDKRIEFFRSIESTVKAVPGVEDAALATSLPLFSYNSDRQVFVDAPSSGDARDPVASHVMITPDYFSAMGIPVREGRTFAADMKPGGPEYILVNETLARHFWPHESAVGKRLGVIENSRSVLREIIGVVGDTENAANIANPTTRLVVYKSLPQEPWSYVNLVVRSRNPGALIDAVRTAVSRVDPDMPADDVATVPQSIDRAQHNLVVVGQMLVGFAALGLVLAAVGLYGVISNIVAQRTGEFGIRLALGAQTRDILVDVLARGVRLALIGLALGFLGAWALGQFLGSLMPRLVRADPLALVGVSLLLFVITVIASWFPARRATKVDPLVALRAE